MSKKDFFADIVGRSDSESKKSLIKKKVTKTELKPIVKKTSKTISGRGRGMVVVRSRKHCVLFHEEFVKQMKQRNLSDVLRFQPSY